MQRPLQQANEVLFTHLCMSQTTNDRRDADAARRDTVEGQPRTLHC